MIVSKGFGILGVAIPLGYIFAVKYVTDKIFGEAYYEKEGWTFALALFLSAITVYIAGRKLNKNNTRILIDKETGEEVKIVNSHSLFWIPLQYWGFILFAFAVFVYIKKG